MGKRSSFERRPRDFYPTPREAVLPLLPHLKPRTRYCEPCAGDGALIDHLAAFGHVCARARDIEPRRDDIDCKDALTTLTGNIDCFITNPPWGRVVLHPLIGHLSDQAPTWLLFDADWIHTRQATHYVNRLRKIVSVGRIKWIPDSPFTGKDNCAWHLFGKPRSDPAVFFGRAARPEPASRSCLFGMAQFPCAA
jgi:hypothetical protein